MRRAAECIFGLLFGAQLLALTGSLYPPQARADEVLQRFREDRVKTRGHAYLVEGRAAVQKANYFRAVRVLSDAIRMGAEAEAFKLRGIAHARIGDHQAALADMSRYVGSNSSDPEGFVLRGDLYAGRHDHDLSINDYSSAIRLDPSSGEAHRGRAVSCMATEDYEQAAQDLRFLLERDPQDAEALTNMGTACLMAGMHECAKEYWGRAVAAEVDSLWKQKLQSLIATISTGKRTSHDADVTGRAHFATPDPASSASRRDPSGSGSTSTNKVEHPDSEAVETQKHPDTGSEDIASPRIDSDFIATGAIPEELSGQWETTYLAHSVSVTFRKSGKRINGVLRVKSPTGKEDTYHYAGTVEGNQFRASHHSGHSFKGQLTPQGRVVGEVTTVQGRSFTFDFPTSTMGAASDPPSRKPGPRSR